ncbi:MAG: glycosyltransferase family 25 [Solumvirus sp.]|uniref:Glycosyltransferase family 25 n=1 Tax=Solumvirus sp. TaxID=2487773 RepID=A0A3G5AGL0_9VIRU|nr:MAG: glycosyltransferase family 25 [Solumvirus sp.]
MTDLKSLDAKDQKEVVSNTDNKKEIPKKLLDDKGIEVPILIISLDTEKEVARRQRLMSRLKYHGIEDSVTHIKAIYKDDADIKIAKGDFNGSSNSEIGCMLSHLKAAATFLLKMNLPRALIFESDPILINGFKDEFLKVVKGMVSSTPLLMINNYTPNKDGVIKNGDYVNITARTYSTLSYVITREYAKTILDKYTTEFKLNTKNEIEIKWLPFSKYKLTDCIQTDHKKPLTEDNKRITAEVITILSNGIATAKNLCIGESLDTSIQPLEDMQWHQHYYKQLEPINYLDADIACEHEDVLKVWGIC